MHDSKQTQVKVIGIEGVRKLTTLLNGDNLILSVDIETTGLSAFKDKIVCLQFGTLKSVFILDCRPFYTLDDTGKEQWKEILVQFFSRIDVCVGFNIKFDYKFLYKHFGVKLNSVIDCMLQELVIYGVGMSKAENEGISVNMHDTATRYGMQVSKSERQWFIGLDKRQEEWLAPFPESQVQYGAQDVLIPLRVNEMQQVLLKERELTYVADLEHLCLPAIAHMELNGCFIDKERWQAIVDVKKAESEVLEKEIQRELDPYMQAVRQRIYEEEYSRYLESEKLLKAVIEKLAYTFESSKTTTKRGKSFIVVKGDSLTWSKFKALGVKELKESTDITSLPKLDTSIINIGSSKQLIEALGEMGIQLEKTDREHLEPHVHNYPLIGKLLRWKDLDHFINAFGESILSKIEVDGRVHPEYNQLGTATGRMSCKLPNWQQLPAREPDETSVRKCVIAQEGNVLLTADLPNIELRIVSDMSKDENMLYSFENGEDLHSKTARIMFELADDIDPKKVELVRGFTYRQVAKVINFGLVYGMSPIKLSKTLGIGKEKAVELFDRYFTAYEGVRSWLEETANNAKLNGYSMTYAGRKRFYNFMEVGEYDRNTMEWETFISHRALAYKINGGYERRAKNHPVQGTNADITKHALVLLQKYLPDDSKIIACVHDEIVLEVPKDKAEIRAKLLSMCLYKACIHYLHTVHIPEIDVEVAEYWKKG